MIREKDTYNVYNYSLTEDEPHFHRLEFAVKQFRYDHNIHCVVKKNTRTGEFAVFIKGRTPVSTIRIDTYVIVDHVGNPASEDELRTSHQCHVGTAEAGQHRGA